MGKILKFVKRNKEETKKRILTASITVFAKHSYDQATFKIIEAEAGVSETLITRYFNNKHGLVVAVIAKINEDFFNNIDDDIAHQSLYDELHHLGEKMSANFFRNSEKISALFSIASYDPAFIDEVTSYKEKISPSIKRIKQFQDSGEIPKEVDIDLLYKNLITLLHSILHTHLLTAHQPYESVKEIVHFSIDMFIYGISKENRSLMNDRYKAE